MTLENRKLLSARDLSQSWFMTFAMFSNKKIATCAISSLHHFVNLAFEFQSIKNIKNPTY